MKVPEVSDGYASLVLSGIEHRLIEEGFFFVVSHLRKHDLIRQYEKLLLGWFILRSFVPIEL